MTRKRRNDADALAGALFEAPDKRAEGPVYKDTCKQLAAMVKAGTLDPDTDAGRMSSARSLARSIDMASGRGGRKPDTYALAGLHKELRETFRDLRGAAAGDGDAAELAAILAGEVTPA